MRRYDEIDVLIALALFLITIGMYFVAGFGWALLVLGAILLVLMVGVALIGSLRGKR